MKYLLKFHLCVLVCVLCNVVFANDKDIRFRVISTEDGLSSNQINTFYKDNAGFMWIGTRSGLNRYDGYNIKTFKHSPSDSTSLKDNYVVKVVGDVNDYLWILSPNSRLCIYDPVHDNFIHNLKEYDEDIIIPQNGISDINAGKDGKVLVSNDFFGAYVYDSKTQKTQWIQHVPGDTTSIVFDDVSSIEEDALGNYWLVNHRGVIERVNAKTLKVDCRKVLFSKSIDASGENFRLFIDKNNNVWCYSESTSLGAACYDTSEDSVYYFLEKGGDFSIDNNVVKDIAQDSLGLVWIGMDHGGVNIFDKKSGIITSVEHQRGKLNALPENSITSLFLDDMGIVWVGLYKGGIAYYHSDFFKFNMFYNNPFDDNSLSNNDINAFAEDLDGNIWIGSNGGGLMYYSPANNSFKTYKHQPSNANSLSKDVVISLMNDSQERLWIGTYFGGVNVYKDGQFKHYKHQPDVTNSLSNDRVWTIFEDSRNQIWIGTLGGGLDFYDAKDDGFIHYKHGELHSVGSNFIYSIAEDRNGNLWFGTINGIDVLNWESQRFHRYEHHPKLNNSLSDSKVMEIKRDSRDLMWVATTDGLNVFDESSNTFRIFRQDDGLADNSILGIEEDDLGHIWVMTSKGLTEIELEYSSDVWQMKCTFNNFDQKDGLENQHFNERASLKTRSGELLFGGVNGFSSINPSKLETFYYNKKLKLIQFKLFNNIVKVNEKVGHRVLLDKAFHITDEITLKYNENVFAISFGALDFFHPDKLIYEYRLEGFNDKWFRTSANSREATYTNLNPGVYNFRVRASENGQNWFSQEAQLTIRILPPLWATNWAYFSYFCLLILLLVLWRYFFLKKEKNKIIKHHELEEVERLAKLNDMKFRFFTNVSHEFRTPLTLIISPIKKLINNTTDTSQIQQLKIIERNGMRLLNLVNQLLDFRKLEVDKHKLCVSSGDIIQFVKEKTEAFISYSENKGVALKLETETDRFNTFFDHDKIEKIIYNLLSNAFKFTLNGGEVKVMLSVDNQKEKMIKIRVSDTGMGIDAEMIDHIFDRFFQDDHQEKMLNQGSGIGLSLAKEFVELHGGRIEVDSTWGEGSVFTVFIPSNIQGDSVASDDDKCAEELVNTHKPESDETENNTVAETLVDVPKDKPLLLLVEDNDDLRLYLSENLKEQYRIVEASNGQEGYVALQDDLPTIIVCDLMMPIMSGLELCEKVKEDDRYAHIPFILLTAATSLDNELKGLEVGADDYITKPFNYDVLELKINNIVARRKQLHAKFNNAHEISPSDICITSVDEKFFKKALAVVNENLTDVDFSIDKMCEHIGISRAHLYNKLLAITGKTPAEFIKIMRLKRAAQLLRESQLTVAEISYDVGYNGPRYFTKHFKDFYGQTPSQYAKSVENATSVSSRSKDLGIPL